MLWCYNPIMHYFYIFLCKDKTFYCGSTNDLKRREFLHNSGKGAKYTRGRGPGKIIYSEKFKTLGKALRREAEVKKWSRVKKQTLVKITRPAHKKHVV